MQQAYVPVDRDLLGFKGRLYPADMLIECRGAGVPEIRAWSNIRENDPTSVSKAIIDIITACTRVSSTTGAHSYNVKDLYEHDKLVLLALVHEITFADKHQNNMHVSGECGNPLCGKVFEELVVTPANFTFKVPDDKYIKYIDGEEGKFVIQTKNYGTIEYRPSTIGLGNAMFNWIGTFKPNFVKENQAMFRMVQSLVLDWRTANDKALRRLQVEQYNNMNPEVLAFRTHLLDELSIELKNELEYVCPDCGATFRCNLAFTEGMRELFLPAVQDFDAELL
jgi:hypothetical protein